MSTVSVAGDRLLRSAAGGTCAAAISAVGHRAGGGAAPSATALAVVVILIGATSVAAGRVRWTFARLLVALVAAQPLIHVLFGGHAPSSGGHDMASMSTHSAHAHGGGGWSMVVMHAAFAALTAIVLRYGVRWLVAMPACMRAVGVVARDPSPWPVTVVAMVPATVPALHVGAPSKVWNSRGPPR